MAARFEIGARERKPRTNEEAAEYWADGILAREPMTSYMDVNSVQLRGDTIYSFGSHFPMAKVIRDSRGYVRRVVVNSDHYPARGFGNTGYDQSNVRRATEDRVGRARRKIQLDHLPLTEYGHHPALRLRPELNDLEPEPYPRTTIPTYFYAADPGPEPVDDGVGCIADTREAHTWVEEKFVMEGEQLPGDEYVRDAISTSGERKWIYVKRTTEGFICWRREAPNYWDRQEADKSEVRIELKQCPHCEAFAQLHARWNVQMNGGWGRGGRVQGYARHRELMGRFGGEQGWRDARREDYRRVRRLKKLRQEWEARNFCGLHEAPTDRHGIVTLDADGYVPRRPVERIRERRAVEARKAERQRRRDEREYQAHLRREARERKAALKQWVETGVTVPNDEVVDWCVKRGITPNPDGTVTLVKAVQAGSYRSGYNGGLEYKPGTTVTAPDYTRTPHCGHGLHFGPNVAVAAKYLGYYVRDGAAVFLSVRVPLDTLIPVSDKCKAESCYVEGILT